MAAICLALAILAACKHNAERTLEEAGDAWDSKNYQLATQLYERYLQGDPGSERSIQAHFQAANIYYLDLHRYEEAKNHYSAFLNLAPSNPNAPLARERLADILAETGRSYQAIAEYENLNPQDEKERRRIRLRIADLYFDHKNYSQAITEYDKVTAGAAYDDLSSQAYRREASIYHLARGQYQQAIPLYRKLASEGGDTKAQSRALYDLADCYAGLYQYDEAIKTLREIQDPAEQTYVDRKILEFDQRSRERGQAAAANRGSPGRSRRSRDPEASNSNTQQQPEKPRGRDNQNRQAPQNAASNSNSSQQPEKRRGRDKQNRQAAGNQNTNSGRRDKENRQAAGNQNTNSGRRSRQRNAANANASVQQPGNQNSMTAANRKSRRHRNSANSNAQQPGTTAGEKPASGTGQTSANQNSPSGKSRRSRRQRNANASSNSQ